MDFREVRGRLIQLDLWSSSFETLPGVVDKFVQEYRRKMDHLIVDDSENEWKHFQEVKEYLLDQGYTAPELVALCLWLDAPLGPNVKVFTTLCDLWFHLVSRRKKEVGEMLGGLSETKWVGEAQEKAHRAKPGFIERGPLPDPLYSLLDRVFRDISAFATLLKSENAHWLHYERYQGSFRWGKWFRDEWRWNDFYSNRLWIGAQGRWRDVRGPRFITSVLTEQSNLRPYVSLSPMQTLGFNSVFPQQSALPVPGDLAARRKDLHLFTNHQRRELLSRALTQIAMGGFFELFVNRRFPQTGAQEQKAAIDTVVQRSKTLREVRRDLYDLRENLPPPCPPRLYAIQIAEVLVDWVREEHKQPPEANRETSWNALKSKLFSDCVDLKQALDANDTAEMKKYTDKRAKMTEDEKKQHRVSPSDLPIHPAILQKYFLQFILEDLKHSFWEMLLPAVVSVADALGQLKSQLLSAEVSEHPSSTNLFQLVRILEDDYHTFLASVDRRSEEAQPYTLLPQDLFEKLRERRAEEAHLLTMTAMIERGETDFKRIAYGLLDHKTPATMAEDAVAQVQKVNEGTALKEYEEKEQKWLKIQLGDIANMRPMAREKVLRAIEPTREFFAFVFGEMNRLQEDTKVLCEKVAAAVDKRQDPRVDAYETLKRIATKPDLDELKEALWTTPLGLQTESDYKESLGGLVRLAADNAHELRGILKKVRVLVQSDRQNSNVYAVNLHPKLKELANRLVDPPPERKSERKDDAAVRAVDDDRTLFKAEQILTDMAHELHVAPDLATRLTRLFALFLDLVRLKMLYNTCLVV